MKTYQPLFDVVFYIRPEFNVEADGVRSDDPAFAVAMAGIFEDVVEAGLGSKRIVPISGSVDERLWAIQEEFKNLGLRERNPNQE